MVAGRSARAWSYGVFAESGSGERPQAVALLPGRSFRGARVCSGTTIERRPDVGWVLAHYGAKTPLARPATKA
jgi:hypothetical protein